MISSDSYAVMTVCLLVALTGPTMGMPRPQAPTTVREVNAARAAFVGNHLRVRGRVVAEESESAAAGPCNRATGAGCNPVVRVTLHLVDPDGGESGRLDLYHSTPDGPDEPITCRILGLGSYDCSPYAVGTIAVVAGVFKRYAEPVQQVIHPDGSVEVLHTRDIFFLCVDGPR